MKKAKQYKNVNRFVPKSKLKTCYIPKQLKFENILRLRFHCLLKSIKTTVIFFVEKTMCMC